MQVNGRAELGVKKSWERFLSRKLTAETTFAHGCVTFNATPVSFLHFRLKRVRTSPTACPINIKEAENCCD